MNTEKSDLKEKGNGIIADVSSCILPFRMKIDKQVEGIDVIAFLSRNGIGLLPNFSYPFHLILYKGNNEVLTMTDEWVWDKYENSIPLISYDEHKAKYCY